MKKVILFMALVAIVNACLAQATSLTVGNYLVAGTQYLISPNGKYKFYNLARANEGNKRYWVIKNLTTGEEIFESKGMPYNYYVHNGYTQATLTFQYGYTFTGATCIPPQAGVQCQNFAYNQTTVYVPMLETIYWTGSGFSNNLQLHGPFDFIGIPSAFQHYGSFVPQNHPTVPVPKDEEVFVKNATNGVYSVPVAKRASALKLLNDGNMVIVNNVGAILWESATGEQQLIDSRLNKKFKDVSTSFAKGLGLMAQGNVELINTGINQSANSVVLFAHTYVQLLPGSGSTTLTASGPTGYILLNCIAGAPVSAARGTGQGAPELVVPAPIDKPNGNVLHGVTAYPNPTNGIVQFNTGTADERITYISIIDITGRYSLQRYADTDRADLTELPKGSYLFKVITNKGTYTGKIIKQ